MITTDIQGIICEDSREVSDSCGKGGVVEDPELWYLIRISFGSEEPSFAETVIDASSPCILSRDAGRHGRRCLRRRYYMPPLAARAVALTLAVRQGKVRDVRLVLLRLS